jgi:putative hydrolase of the HAD superfamily
VTDAASLVLFDLDGVLATYDRPARVAHLAESTGATTEVVRTALFDSGLEDRFDAGEISGDRYLRELGDALGTRVEPRAWANARRAAMRVDPALPSLLAKVRAHADIAVLTNNGALLVDLLPDIAPTLAAVFGDRVLCSGRLRARKPARRAYEDAVGILGHAPSATLFLDDSPANVEGARRAGLRAAHVPSPAALAGVLSAYGVG